MTATDITISESGENWVVAWTESAVDSDVAGYYVCFNRGAFTASEMKIMIDAGACVMVAEGTEATIPKYTTAETTTVHFRRGSIRRSYECGLWTIYRRNLV